MYIPAPFSRRVRRFRTFSHRSLLSPFSTILVDFIAVLGHFLGQNRSKMAYKGQKVQKVMVQPIVSFLMVVKVLFSRYKVLKSGAIGARVWFDISFILLLVTGTTAKHFKCSMIFLSFLHCLFVEGRLSCVLTQYL